jgi:hypothetical protein
VTRIRGRSLKTEAKTPTKVPLFGPLPQVSPPPPSVCFWHPEMASHPRAGSAGVFSDETEALIKAVRGVFGRGQVYSLIFVRRPPSAGLP